MSAFVKILILLVLLCTLTACFQVETVVRVKTDGSGLIEETFLMKKDFLDQIRVMAEGMAKEMDHALSGGENQGADARSGAKEFDVFDEAKLRERAKDMGDGVTYVKGAKVAADGYDGYKATYAFKDVGKVRINQNPREKVPGDPQQGGPDAKTAKEYLTFAFTRGDPAELIIRSPSNGIGRKSEDGSEGGKPSQGDTKPSEEVLSQLKAMFQGMRFGLAVEVDGDIVGTNATHRDGSRVTLLELDFGKLLDNPEKFKKFSDSKPGTMEEAKLLMQDLPGIKVDLNEEIKIRFAARKT